LSVLTLIAVFAISCSRIDSSTSLGTEILRAQDSSLTDFDQNFKSISSKLKVLNYSSFINVGALSQAFHPTVHAYTDTMVVGSWRDELSTGYVEFGGNSVVNALNRMRPTDSSKSTYKITSMELIFTISTPDTGKKGNLTVRAINSKAHTKPLDRQTTFGTYCPLRSMDSVIWGTTDTAYSISYKIDTLTYDALTGAENISHYGAKDTTFIKDARDSIIKVEIDVDSTNIAYNPISYMIESDNGQIKLPTAGVDAPRIRITCERTDSTAKKDTIVEVVSANYVDYSVAIDGDYNGSRDTLAITDNATGRVGVIAFDMRQFWAAMNDTLAGLQFKNILHAQIKLSLKTAFSAEKSAFLNYAYMFSDSLLTGTTFSSAGKSATKSIAIDTTTDSLLNGIDTCIIALRDINNYESILPDTGYLYLMPTTTSFQEIVWKQNISDGLDIEAVFSNPR
jgi:hypothetical protein